MANQLRLGLFGGSFDPVHCGHIRLALAAQKEFRLDKVLFIPARIPPHKKGKTLAAVRQRMEMLSLATAPYPRFAVSDFEVRRKATTYSFQTVRHFRRHYPDAALYFIIGSDSLNELGTWKRADILFSLCRFIVGKRKGSRLLRPGPHIPADFLRYPLPAISSSGIRQRAHSGKSIMRLVPRGVAAYIAHNNLYRKDY